MLLVTMMTNNTVEKHLYSLFRGRVRGRGALKF